MFRFFFPLAAAIFAVGATATPMIETLDYFDATAIINNASDLKLSYETGQALAAIGGISNRQSPRFYVRASESDDFWLQFLRRRNPVHQRNLSSLQQVISEAAARGIVRGTCVYDENVPATALVCSTAAGLFQLLPVCGRPGSPILAMAAVAKLQPHFDLRGKFSGPNSKVDAYAWALDNLLGTWDGAFLAFFADYGFTKQNFAGGSQTLNHDFVIKNRGFFFDLDPWPTDVPTDAPQESKGADYNMMLRIFSTAVRERTANTFAHLTGFPPWVMNKYHPSGVALEWQFSKVASSYSIFMDADACCIGTMANAALYSLFRSSTVRKQNPAPTVESLKQQGLLDPTTMKPFPSWNYAAFYVGDFDSAAWVYSQFAGYFGNRSTREALKIKLGLAIDPGPSLTRFPLIWDYIYEEAGITEYDRFIAGDSGFGYTNPTQLLAPREPSGLPSAGAAWKDLCSAGYKQLDISFSGFLINGAAGNFNNAKGVETLQLYCSFSPAGVVLQEGYFKGDSVPCGGGGNSTSSFLPVFFERDLPQGGAQAGADSLVKNSPPSGGSYSVYRGVLRSVEYYAQVRDLARQQNPNIKIVDPLELSLLWKLSKQ